MPDETKAITMPTYIYYSSCHSALVWHCSRTLSTTQCVAQSVLEWYLLQLW